MKRVVRNIIVFFILIAVGSCEVIKDDEQLIPVEESGKASVLLTEFTGIGCVNCPKAAAEAERLKQSYGEQLVVVEMHAPSNPFTAAKKEYDYTCSASDKYYLRYGGTSSTSLPAGVINGAMTNGAYFTDYQLWGAAVASAAQRTTDTELEITAELSGESLIVSIETENVPSESMLIVWLTEDSLVGPQLMPDGTTNMTYLHNHVLRDELYTGYAAPSYSAEYTINEDWVAQNCNIVAFVSMSDGSVVNVKSLSLRSEQQTEQSELLLSVDGIGVIKSDTTIVIDETRNNVITGKPEMEITGMLTYSGVLQVEVKREDPEQEDQFCCADQCVNTNYETQQQLEFSVNGLSKWFAHYTPERAGEARLIYHFAPKGANRKLTVIYRYNQ